MTNINVGTNIIENYIERQSTEFNAVPSDNGFFLLTPFYRPDGEGIELEIETLPGGHMRLTDMGDTMGYLFINGLTMNRAKLERARSICRPYGVLLEHNVLSVDSEPELAGEALHGLIQAALAVTDLIHTDRPASPNRVRFANAVESFIIRSGATYDADYEVRGQRRRHKFGFHVNTGRNLLVPFPSVFDNISAAFHTGFPLSRERRIIFDACHLQVETVLVQPITASTEAVALKRAEQWEIRFMDVTKANETWFPVAVLDDRGKRSVWTPDAIAPIRQHAIVWAEKDRLAALLAGDLA